MTRSYAITASAVSIIAHPVPGIDEVVVIPIHYHLCMKIAKARNLRIRDLPWRNLNKIIVGGAILRYFVDLPFAFFPPSGILVHGMTAGALTVFLGRYLETLGAPASYS